MNLLVFINVVIFFVTQIQFVINIKLHTPDVFRHNTEASTIQYIQGYLPLILQVLYHRLIAPTQSQMVVAYLQRRYIISLSLRLVKLYKSC
jgi:hypothetical protein